MIGLCSACAALDGVQIAAKPRVRRVVAFARSLTACYLRRCAAVVGDPHNAIAAALLLKVAVTDVDSSRAGAVCLGRFQAAIKHAAKAVNVSSCNALHD